MFGEILLIILAFGLVISAAVGIFLPLLPGVPLAWLGVLVFALATDFMVITIKFVLIFLGLTILVTALDALMPVLGAKKYNASRYGVAGSVLGLFLGLIFLGPIGIIIGPFAGAFLGELLQGKSKQGAFHSAKGTFLGFLLGNALKLALILVMLGFLIYALI